MRSITPVLFKIETVFGMYSILSFTDVNRILLGTEDGLYVAELSKDSKYHILVE